MLNIWTAGMRLRTSKSDSMNLSQEEVDLPHQVRNESPLPGGGVLVSACFDQKYQKCKYFGVERKSQESRRQCYTKTEILDHKVSAEMHNPGWFLFLRATKVKRNPCSSNRGGVTEDTRRIRLNVTWSCNNWFWYISVISWHKQKQVHKKNL